MASTTWPCVGETVAQAGVVGQTQRDQFLVAGEQVGHGTLGQGDVLRSCSAWWISGTLRCSR